VSASCYAIWRLDPPLRKHAAHLHSRFQVDLQLLELAHGRVYFFLRRAFVLRRGISGATRAQSSAT
jgi:hypothetical protein